MLSDDRIILRRHGEQYWIYGTPWHGEAAFACAARAPLARIAFLRHGLHNALAPQRAARAMGHLFACSFPPFYHADALDFTLQFFHDVVRAVPCDDLIFLPDARVVTFLQQVAG